MNRKQIILIACAVSLLSVGAIATRQIESKSTDEVLVTNLTQQIAQLEVKQALLASIYTQDAPQFTQVIAEKANLAQRLEQLQSQSYQTQVVVATTNALESKLGELEVEYAKDRSKLSEHHPVQQTRQSQMNNIRQRLIALR
ncbi:hypothetical protein [Nostoc sp. FACHB-190]|uniref:hypothetical protein n=1 Tax=Nostoc sp. FACHB-190 TaxID=2692838 RepID=UPI001688B75D|nr:hypothetical protein [Nostoc sp. FACHB-190]MBD2299946.1 hypothetical protein [Nostoc sp. FACHB-190]